ncbi:nucleotidyltransferase substrate binding protein [Candidatus Magnetaquicoccus inordinatus]|uniref:nucleotidyltransferase substrate binding protein n=1 Tax=Candidatus Magnetaquicoccus inordinatus TaxID=2496818 RepID=UPI00102C41E1|nr:nucleotidyltransferase substrate binding protein [Candidatus Magnetaquicoccus inordinatus]
MQTMRWQQRLENFQRALQTLDAAMALASERPLSQLEQQGLIQGFEYTHELAWKLLKDYLEYQGVFGLIGSRDATRSAFKNGLITQGELWMQMIADRNLTSHTYEQSRAQTIADAIAGSYYPAFQELAARFIQLQQAAGE